LIFRIICFSYRVTEESEVKNYRKKVLLLFLKIYIHIYLLADMSNTKQQDRNAICLPFFAVPAQAMLEKAAAYIISEGSHK